jgi:sulfotransferase
MKKFYFVSGLPRAGSTLLCNILAQNPNFHATQTSGCLEVLFLVRNEWDGFIEHKAHPLEKTKKKVLQGIMQNYYWDVEKPVIIDKSRGWLAHIEMLEWLLEQPVKILVPVRDIRDVLSSFEKLWRQSSKSRQLLAEQENYIKFQRLEGRLQIWCASNEPVGLATDRIKDAVARGFRDRMHFVDYDCLTTDPQQALQDVYEFLELEFFQHNFNHVKQVTQENDDVHEFGVPLHKIRSKVEYRGPQYPAILGEEVADKYINEAYFWKRFQ